MSCKIVLFTLFALLTQQDILASNKSVTEDFNFKIKRIIISLDSVITNSPNKNLTVQQHFELVKDKINNADLVVKFDSTLKYDFYECSSFNVLTDSEQKVDITFGQFVLDKYNTYPYLAYAIVIHTFQYAFDYFNNQSLFLISTENPIENAFFKLDAIALESMFLKTYVADHNKLGPLEKFLIADLNYGLLSSPILFMKTDIKLLHKMDDLKSRKDKGKFLLKEFDKIGKELIKNSTFENKSDWENFCTVVSLRTYLYYSKQVIFDIVHAKDGISLESFNMEQYKDNMSTIDDIKQLIGLNEKYLGLSDSILKNFGDKYIN